MNAHVDRAALPDAATYFAGVLGETPRRARRYRCPICGAGSLSVDSDKGWRCFGACDAGGGVLDFEMLIAGGDLHDAARRLGCLVDDERQEAAGERQARAQRQQAQRRAAEAARRADAEAQAARVLSPAGWALWRSAQPLAGPAMDYLQRRVCVVPPADGDLRWLPQHRHPSGYVGPALVALCTDAADASIARTLHFTSLRADGSGKADIDRPRLLLPGHRKAGAVVRLWPDEAVTTGLGVAEGIETALSLAHAFKPVWAAIDAGNLAALPVLPGIESLLVAADHDQAGVAAAEACAQRWADAGREVAIAMPPTAKYDFNDVARRAA